MAGCLGCSVAPVMLTLNIMRAVAGVGGGGLITMGDLTYFFVDKLAPRRALADRSTSDYHQLGHDSL